MCIFSKPVYSIINIYNLTNGIDNYIGSTQDTLETRLRCHRYSYSSYKRGLIKNYITSAIIIDKGNYRMELLDKCFFNNYHEVRSIEGSYQKEIPCVNKRYEGTTKKEQRVKYYHTHLQETKQYYQKNKKKLRENHTCICGGKYTTDHISAHKKSKKHAKYLYSLQSV